jgi:hypothetical protein
VRVVASLALLAACGRENFGEQHDAPVPIPDQRSIDADPRLPGLLAWYGMEDDPSDGTSDDAGGGARVARCITGVSCPTQVAGVRGNAVAFDGTQYLRVSYGAWLATPTAFTIGGWINLDVQVDQVAFAKPWGASSLDSWGIVAWAPPSTAGTCLETVGAATTAEDACGPTITTNRWFHVAGRWDGQVKAIFIDGVKAGERTNAPVAMMDTHDMLIGTDENSGSQAYWFRGKVDEVQVYDRALTDAEIAMLATP